MIKSNFDQLVEKLAKIGKVSKDEIKKRIEAKREALSGLISFEGAAQIVAAELGIKFDSLKLNLADLIPGMRRINVVGKIIEIYGIKKYIKNGKELRVASLLLADSTDAIRVVIWDEKIIGLIEQGKIKKEDVIEIVNGVVRGDFSNKEIHLSRNSELNQSNLKLENVVEKSIYPFRFIKDLSLNAKAKIKSTVVQVFKPFTYQFCKECKKSQCMDKWHEKEKRVLIPFIADDGTETLRCIAFNEAALRLVELAKANLDELEIEWLKLNELLGLELWIEGRVRKNEFRDSLELVAENIEAVEPENLIEKLKD